MYVVEIAHGVYIRSMKNKKPHIPHVMSPIEKITSWVGSYTSLAVHTTVFALSFVSVLLGLIELDLMLLVLTTIVSLEAIYLAIFIQMSVNNQATILHEVEHDIDDIAEDIDEIQVDIDEIQEDVDEIQEDIDEIQEDVDEMTEEEKAEEARETHHAVTLEKLTNDLHRLLKDIESLKRAK